MARMKTFFIYFVLIIAFFIFSQIIIYLALNTTFQQKKIETKTPILVQMELQATSVNGFAKGKVINNTQNIIENKYLKIECYSKHDVLMGTKYIRVGKLDTNEEKEFEVHFNFNRVDRAVIDIVDEKILEVENATEEDKVSDEQKGLAAIIAGVILLMFL